MCIRDRSVDAGPDRADIPPAVAVEITGDHLHATPTVAIGVTPVGDRSVAAVPVGQRDQEIDAVPVDTRTESSDIHARIAIEVAGDHLHAVPAESARVST